MHRTQESQRPARNALPSPSPLPAPHPGLADRRRSSHITRASPDPINPPRDPRRHTRTPSLGELAQEIEYEQEAQVVRLLPPVLRSPPPPS